MTTTPTTVALTCTPEWIKGRELASCLGVSSAFDIEQNQSRNAAYHSSGSPKGYHLVFQQNHLFRRNTKSSTR